MINVQAVGRRLIGGLLVEIKVGSSAAARTARNAGILAGRE
jgi:hypothetical protein